MNMEKFENMADDYRNESPDHHDDNINTKGYRLA